MNQPAPVAPAEPAPAEQPPADASVPAKLHDDALKAEKHLESLATGLASAGAPDPVVKGISRMADAVRQVVKSLKDQSAGAPPPEPKQPKPTMDSATNDLASDLKSNR